MSQLRAKATRARPAAGARARSAGSAGRLRSAETNLRKMLDVIAPYSPKRARLQEEPPLRWVSEEVNNMELIQNDL